MGIIGFTSATKISILLGISLIALCFGALIGGYISDKIKTRYGQRAPLIFIGTLLASSFFLIIPLMTQYTKKLQVIYPLLLGIFVLLHLSLGAAYSPWLALVADLFKKEERTAAGISINIFSAIGAAIAAILFSKLIDIGQSWIIWIITGLVLLISGVFTTILIPKENYYFEVTEVENSQLRNVLGLIWNYGGVVWVLLLIVNLLWAFSSHLIETGVVDSLIERFIVSDTKASFSSNILMGVYIVILLFPALWLINKIGKIRASILTSLLYSVFCILLSTMQNFNAIFYIVFIGGACNILLSTLQIALPADIVPKNRVASFMGMFFVFGTAVKPLATFIQGLLLENKEVNTSLSNFGGYPWVFLIAAIVCISTIILLLGILQIEKNSQSTLDEKIKEK